MSGRDQSDAIWIRQQEQKPSTGGRHQSIDFGSFPSRFAFGRSMSVNSEGASTTSSSPPYSPIDMNANITSKSPRLGFNPSGPGGPGTGRFRTSSFSAGYGPSYGQEHGHYEKDPYMIHSPLSTSAPGRDGFYRRSNSISVGAMEYGHGKAAKNGAALGPIEEVTKMNNFGDAFKRSMGQLFSSPKLSPPPKVPMQNGAGQKKQGQMKDRVVSMLCESTFR